MKMAEELHVQVMEPVVMTDSAHKRFKLAPALAFMEQNLFRPRPAKYTKPVEEIHLATVKNPQEELILVARQINALIRQGYRYREIAVVTGAVEAYQSYMDPVFTKYEIPYFMDTTKEVLFHPFIECIRAALEIVDTNFSYEAVMRFLRCGFCDIAEGRSGPAGQLSGCNRYPRQSGVEQTMGAYATAENALRSGTARKTPGKNIWVS